LVLVLAARAQVKACGGSTKAPTGDPTGKAVIVSNCREMPDCEAFGKDIIAKGYRTGLDKPGWVSVSSWEVKDSLAPAALERGIGRG